MYIALNPLECSNDSLEQRENITICAPSHPHMPFHRKDTPPLKRMSAVLLLLNLPLLVAAENATEVTFDRLLREMVDLQKLAEYPNPPYLAARASSYEPGSPVDSVPAGFGNNDHGHYRDTLPEGVLMLDAQGPGVITHIWSANANDSLVFYFDADSTPSWTVSMQMLLGGDGCIKSPFSHVAALGQNCYFPIPYQARCRVFYKGGTPDIYYHIDYRTYSASTTMKTFDSTLLSRYLPLIDSIGAIMTDANDSGSCFTNKPNFDDRIEPGQSVVVAQLDGPGAISDMVITANMGFSPKFLRTCLLEITFDGAVYPQVRLPLGDFFCAGPRQKPYRTLPLRLTAQGALVSQWYMPYRKRATVRLVNKGDKAGECSVRIAAKAHVWNENTMYFFARWRQDPGVVTSRNFYWIFYMTDTLRDEPMLHIRGKGVHVGTILQLWNRENEWWGEGDDKITVDGESQPSFIGTGTEDYFGYAWSTTNSFSHAYHAQPYSDGFAGFTANARFHISDPQPFTKSYQFDMEIQTAYKPTMIDFGRIVFFYALGNATTDHDTLTEGDLFLRQEEVVAEYKRAAPQVEPASGKQLSVRYDRRQGVMLTAASGGSAVVRVFTANGRMVVQGFRAASPSCCLRTPQLPAGVYIADVLINGRVSRVRFVVAR